MGELAGPAEQSKSGRGWRKASRCKNSECVEVLRLDELVMVRDSALPEAILSVAADSWRSFTDAVRAGEFDDLG